VVPDPGRPGALGEVAAGTGDEGPDRGPTPVGALTFDLEDAVGREQLDQLVEAAAVDEVCVAGDRVADPLPRLELPGIHRASLA
jgi:hypothetical protein